MNTPLLRARPFASALRSALRWLVPAALLLAGCRGDAPPPVDADPALWVVRDADTTIYLFGTVHVLQPGQSWFDEAVRDAFDASDTLMLEVVLPGETEMAALVRDLGTAAPDALDLSTQLTAERGARLAAALRAAGRPADSLDRSEPWLAAMLLAAMTADKSGYGREDGVEWVLRAAAERSGKRLQGFETAREQLGFFDGLSQSAQRALLDEAIDGLGEPSDTFKAIVEAWAAGDADRLAALVNEDVAAAPELAEALLHARNRRWAHWIAQRMEQPGTVFVAVGAGHLAGGQSVQAALQQQGLQVTRVAY